MNTDRRLVYGWRLARTGLGLAAVLMFANPPALANSNVAINLAAPFIHLGPGNPYTTHFVVTNAENSANINIKCFNNLKQRVGPAGGANYTALPHGINVFDPVSLGLTVDPNFTGLGWCYFAVISGASSIAVTYLMGASENGNLISTNNARGLSANTAQSGAALGAIVPHWTQEAGWRSYLIWIRPVGRPLHNFSSDLVMKVYNNFGNLLGTYIRNSPGPYDSGFTDIPLAVNTMTAYGSAELGFSGRLMGWVLAYNYASHESFQYPLPLHVGNTILLENSDRP